MHSGDDAGACAEAVAVRGLVERRAPASRSPYLTGTRGFWTLELAVTPATLIPGVRKPSCWSSWRWRAFRPSRPRVADLGTGSGAIALAIARERPRSRHRHRRQRRSKSRAAMPRNRIGNVEFRHGDWLAPLAGETLRPDRQQPAPTSRARRSASLTRATCVFEPPSALSSGAMASMRSAPSSAMRPRICAGCWLLEHGRGGAGRCARCCMAAGSPISKPRDLDRRDRVTA